VTLARALETNRTHINLHHA